MLTGRIEGSMRREEAVLVSGGDDGQDIVDGVGGSQRAGLRTIRGIAHAHEAVFPVIPGDAEGQVVGFDSRSKICKREASDER